jgi:hypothetical protein
MGITAEIHKNNARISGCDKNALSLLSCHMKSSDVVVMTNFENTKPQHTGFIRNDFCLRGFVVKK